VPLQFRWCSKAIGTVQAGMWHRFHVVIDFMPFESLLKSKALVTVLASESVKLMIIVCITYMLMSFFKSLTVDLSNDLIDAFRNLIYSSNIYRTDHTDTYLI
jgi:hypothetical protein